MMDDDFLRNLDPCLREATADVHIHIQTSTSELTELTDKETTPITMDLYIPDSNLLQKSDAYLKEIPRTVENIHVEPAIFGESPHGRVSSGLSYPEEVPLLIPVLQWEPRHITSTFSHNDLHFNPAQMEKDTCLLQEKDSVYVPPAINAFPPEFSDSSSFENASSTPAVPLTPDPKRPQKRVKHAEYKVPLKETPCLPWRLELKAKSIPPDIRSMFSDKNPHVWAGSKEDLLSAYQTYPDIFEADGIGAEGSCLNHLILSGRTWQDIEWFNPYTFVIKRSWMFEFGKARKRTSNSTIQKRNARKKVRFSDSNDSKIPENISTDKNVSLSASAKQTQDVEDYSFDKATASRFQNSNVHNNPDEWASESGDTHSSKPTDTNSTQTHDTTDDAPKLDAPTQHGQLPIHEWASVDEHQCCGFNEHQTIPSDGCVITHNLPSEHDHTTATDINHAPDTVGIGNISSYAFDDNALPQETQFFQIALQTRQPVSIFFGSDLPFFDDSVPWDYAFMGFFIVTNFKKVFSATEKQDKGSSELSMTFEWVGNGSTFSHPYPWWISPAEVSTTIHSNINDMDRATCTNLACFSHIKHYPQTKRSCVVDDTECFGEVDSSDSSSCWFCTTCGRLNAVIPFRLRWSWICRHCKTVGRPPEDINFQPIIFQDAYQLPPPLPVQNSKSPVDHRIQFFKPFEKAIIYQFKSSKVWVKHIPVTDEDTQTDIDSLYRTIQRSLDFIPCSIEPSSLIFGCSLNDSHSIEDDAVSFLMRTVNSFVSDRPGLVKELDCAVESQGLHCTFWPSKGTSKSRLISNRHVLFIAIGSTCELTFILNTNPDRKRTDRTLRLTMPHGSLLVFHRDDECTVTYKLCRTGRLLLLTNYWANDTHEAVTNGSHQ